MGDPFGLLHGLFDLVQEVSNRLDKVESNKGTCKVLKEYMEMTIRPLKALEGKATKSKELEDYVNKIQDIGNETQEVLDKIWKRKSKVKRFFLAGKEEEKLKEITDRWKLMTGLANIQSLVKLHENDQVTKLMRGAFWDVPYSRMCLFCHVTYDGEIVIGGQRPHDKTWELRAYNETGKPLWHWQCSPEMGEPSDLTQISITSEKRKLFAILLENQKKIVLFDNEMNNVRYDDPAYTLTEPGYRLRRMAGFGHRLVISIDPTGAASLDSKSHLKILSCRKAHFSVVRCIRLESLDTHALSSVSNDQVMVICGRPDMIQAFDLDQGRFLWQLEPTQIESKEVIPENVCNIGGDILVYDGGATRIILANVKDNAKWDKALLNEEELGEYVQSMNYCRNSKKLVVLHEQHEKSRITIFNPNG